MGKNDAQKENNIDVLEAYESQIYNALDVFCIDHDIDDLKKESQSVFYAVLRYINRTVFHGKEIFRQKENIYNNNIYNIMPSTYNSYNYDLLEHILDIYIDLCLKYNKECSIIGYSFITGIDYYVIQNWNNRADSNKLTQKSITIYKKLLTIDQETLFSRLYSGSVNPVGIFGIGKQRFGWDDRKTEQTITVNHVLTSRDLPKLDTSNNSQNLQIGDNSSQIVDNANND